MKLYFPLAVVLLLAQQTHAQLEREITGSLLSSEAPTVQFEQLGLQDGLAQSSANSIMQDSNGFIWVATQGGLHRYDGYEFEVFASVPFDTTSLADNWVWTAEESANGDLWVTTMGGGLNRMDPATGKAIHYRYDPEDSTSISSDYTFFSHETRNGDLWVSTFGQGLNLMKAGEDGKFKRYYSTPEDPKTITSDGIFFLKEDQQGIIWAGSGNGLNRIDPATDDITRYLNDPQENPRYGSPLNVTGGYFPPNDPAIIWLATGNGLLRFEKKTGDYERFLIEPNNNGVNEVNFLNDIKPDPNDANILWAGGNGTGVVRFDINKEEFTAYRADPGDKYALNDNEVVSLYLDRSGIMWAGTNNEGLNKFNPGAVNFRHIRPHIDKPSGLPFGIVWGIYEDSQGSLWVGTFEGPGNQHLTRFDGATREITDYQHDPNDPETLQQGNLWSFVEDEGRLWVAGLGGLSLFDPNTGKAVRYGWTVERGSRSLIFDLEAYQKDPNLLWVGSGTGLRLFNKTTGEFTLISMVEGENQPSVLSIHAGAQGKTWLGTTEGLFMVDASGEVKLVSSYDANDTTQINDDLIQCVWERPSEPGVLWLANSRGGGLNRYDTKTGTAKHYTQEDGLVNNVIYGILEDDHGTLWMSTNSGISNFNPETEEFRNYGLEDGLIALEYSQNAYFKAADGTLYFGSNKGVTFFSPENLTTSSTPPQVMLTDLKISNQSVAPGPGSPLKEPISKTEKIELTHDQNEVSIDYVGLHFVNSAKNEYAYRLEGFDDDWVNAEGQRTASYTNLPPGEYAFQVKAANSDGVWNEQGASIQLVVLPPWYQTWWAYTIFVIILATGVFGVDRVQRYRLSKKEKERAVLREAELKAEAENKRRADTEELGKIGRAIISSLSINKIINTIYENVNALMDAAVFGVGIYNEEKRCLEFPATKEEGVMLAPYVNHLDEEHWLSVVCFKEKKEIIIADFDQEHQQYLSTITEPLAGKSPHSIIYLPLIQQGRVIGVITTQSFSKDAYSEYHVNLLRNLANYAAIALDNASAYRKLNATQEQLVHAEKMASLGELTAGIAHEIQNPLNFVNNFSDVNRELIEELVDEMKKGNVKEAESIAKDLIDNEGKITHHGKRAEDIVKSMLQHSRGSEGIKEPTDINALADEYLRLAYHGFRAKDKSFNADFSTNLDEKLPKVEVVPQDIGRVLLNLINNAFQALSSEAKKAGNEFKPELTVSTTNGRGRVQISVKDNGPGIPENIRDKVFQPFFTTKETGEGTGLGLSLSYDIITKGHGGQIEVTSEEGEGTEFIIELPV